MILKDIKSYVKETKKPPMYRNITNVHSVLLEIEKVSRIELFDNSNLFGNFNVSGMVVFVDGKASKNDYRKYKITVDKEYCDITNANLFAVYDTIN